jgi:protein-S-isoprenylcysteine O-methyltransferase Ste14
MSFRIALFAVLAVFAGGWLANARAAAGLSRSTFYTAEEGWVLALVVRVLIGASLGMALVYIVDPHAASWSSVELPAWLRWSAVAASAPVLVLGFWILRALGRNFSTSLVASETLVTHGPYRLVRHPMYAAFLLLWVVLALISANWFVGAAGIAGFAIVLVVRTPKEERLLLALFGDEYRTYMQRTGRIVPRLKSSSRRLSER